MSSTAFAAPRFLDAGDSALVVELGEAIDPAVNGRVIALGHALAALGLAGLHEIVPTYRSLLLLHDPLVLPGETLRAIVGDHWPPAEVDATPSRSWRVPVLYGGDHGVDLDYVARAHYLSTDEVVRLHAGATYRVYMIGFAPGFAYLGGLPDALHTSRRTDPRMRTPARSVSIGGQQTAVSPPIEVPSGWHLIGRTPVRSYDPAREGRPFLFEAGDTIRFAAVSRIDYDRMERAAEAGEIVADEEAPT